jgi:hypothetical protein
VDVGWSSDGLVHPVGDREQHRLSPVRAFRTPAPPADDRTAEQLEE